MASSETIDKQHSSTAGSSGGAAAEQARKRLVKRSDMVAERVAFIDCKMPGSHLKENYSLVGPGVTQSKEQKVSLPEAHGFSLGVAAMPGGITNNLHIHYTAEVFMIYKGKWVFRWGADGKDGEIIGEAGDVISIPTWIFRGFSNIGEDDGWIFTALGGDDTGGILWHPKIINVAAEHGLYLTKDNMMVDTSAGAEKPAEAALMDVIDEESIQQLRQYSVEQMLERVVKKADRQWSENSLLDSAIDGHGGAVASIIGHGITQDRNQEPPINNPHGMSIDWVKLPAEGQLGKHCLTEKQVLILFSGEIEVTVQDTGEPVTLSVGSQDLYSFPADSWRSIKALGNSEAEFVLMTAGDHKKRIEWCREVELAAAKLGRAIDHNGYVAKLSLLPPAVRESLQG